MNEAQTGEQQVQQQDGSNGNGALVNEEVIQAQDEQQLSVTEQAPVKMTPEMEEEAKLRAKYPNPQKPSGSAFIHKMLHRGNKKYFDSGDYNMAQSKIKAKVGSTLNQNNKPVNSLVINNNVNTSHEPVNNQQQQQQQQPILETLSQSPVVSATPTSTNMSPQITSNTSENNKSITTTPNVSTNTTSVYDQVKLTTPVLYNSSTNSNNNSQIHTPTATNNHFNQLNANNSTTLSPSISSQSLLNPHNHHHLSSSISTQSLSSSISTDRLSNIHLNPTNPVCLIDSDEIGHAIPTPECLPQSRKHSIVQSKLATPRTVN